MKVRTLVENDFDWFLNVNVYWDKKIAIAVWNKIKNEYVDNFNERRAVDELEYVKYNQDVDYIEFRVDCKNHTLDYENAYCYLLENELEFDKSSEK